MRIKRWRQYTALLVGVLLFCISIPSFAQTGGCPPGTIPYAPGINNTCIPNFGQVTVAELFGNPDNRLPAGALLSIYSTAGISEPVPPGGGNFGDLPLAAVFGNNDNSPQIIATLGEIALGAGLNPNTVRGTDVPYLNRLLPNSPLRELFRAYERSGVSFANKRVDEIPRLREQLQNLMGAENYSLSGVGGVALNRVLEYAKSGGGVAIQALRNALESRVGSLVNAKLSEIGLDKLLPENFSFFGKALFKDLWNLPIPFAKIKQILEVPIFVPVELANTGTGNIHQTGGNMNLLLNAISGFACPDGGRRGDVDDTSQGRQGGNEARMQLFGNRSAYFRVGGVNTRCGDPTARGFLGAMTAFQGRQVVNAWTVTTAGADITFQFGLRVAVEGIQYQGRMRLCFTKKPWKDILGCSANGALAGGFSLPPIALGKTGVIVMPLRDFLQSFLSNPTLRQTDIPKLLGYALNFFPREELMRRLPDPYKPLVPQQADRTMVPPG